MHKEKTELPENYQELSNQIDLLNEGYWVMVAERLVAANELPYGSILRTSVEFKPMSALITRYRKGTLHKFTMAYEGWLGINIKDRNSPTLRGLTQFIFEKLVAGITSYGRYQEYQVKPGELSKSAYSRLMGTQLLAYHILAGQRMYRATFGSKMNQYEQLAYANLCHHYAIYGMAKPCCEALLTRFERLALLSTFDSYGPHAADFINQLVERRESSVQGFDRALVRVTDHLQLRDYFRGDRLGTV